MSASDSKIPFMDLFAHNREIMPEVFRELERLVTGSEFIGGRYLDEFEKRFAALSGAAHAIGVSNGTDALSLTLRALGIGRGDEVITVANSFIATVEAILHVDAKPVLVDVSPTTGLMERASLEAALTPRTRAVIPVHLYGNPVDLEALEAFCGKHKLALLQDAAQAHGALWNGRALGSYGDAQSYSFYPGKNLGAWGDAGAITTSRQELADRLRALRNHGREPSEKYLHHHWGGNFRMDPVQGVVLSAKLTHLEKKNELRRKLASRYRQSLEGVGDLRFFSSEPKATPVYHLFVVRTERRDGLREYLAKRGITCLIHYPCPLHLQPSLASLGLERGAFPESEQQADQILSLPLFPELSEGQQDKVVAEIRHFYG